MIIKKIGYIAVILGLLLCTSCEIVQEIQFKEDGSGTYSFGLDMSEMMSMGSSSDSTSKQIDTLIRFSDFLALKKDSIQQLAKADREKLAQLSAYELYMKADTVSKQLKMKLNYAFTDLEDMEKFGEKLDGIEQKDLNLFREQLEGNVTKGTPEGSPKVNQPEMLKFNEHFVTTFSKTSFSRKISEKMLQQFEQKKDTTMTPDNPMSNLIRFKQRYIFPYRIAKVEGGNTEKIKILSDFKSVEVEGNLFDISTNPKVFDLEVAFENE